MNLGGVSVLIGLAALAGMAGWPGLIAFGGVCTWLLLKKRH